MTPTQIVEVLQSRGWTAEIVEKSQVEDLVEVNSEGLFKCVDGRLSDHAGMQGPKVLGGVYGIAATRRVLDLEGLTSIVGEVADAGYVPSVHGDDQNTGAMRPHSMAMEISEHREQSTTHVSNLRSELS